MTVQFTDKTNTGSQLAAFVLAGGKSSRMGRDKAALLLNGRTLLQHALATLREALERALEE